MQNRHGGAVQSSVQEPPAFDQCLDVIEGQVPQLPACSSGAAAKGGSNDAYIEQRKHSKPAAKESVKWAILKS
eukprot:scaffold300146_cov23-Tisochrysis_lutea.AAC.1